ncbi:PDZ and LIM domain protein Zasp isoform X14 [Drosophila grimshawi]|uniref:PDZ and LIM domain protein Zasp isoform X14 n=1 Tax=Drosophila grimshawi TaxID=7222 RepID=UPI000C86F4B7|nr:PDZ and LIM domain protein Zasp isoform X14 [Drosophila grimshawi]
MAQPQLLQIKLSRFDAQPWGFRLQGGVDFAQPLLVQKVNAGSLSEQAGMQPGDAVIKINDVDVFSLRHKDAQDIVVRSGNNFVVTVQRGGSTWRPHVTPTGNLPQANSPYLQTVTKTSLAHQQQDSQHIGCGYNNSARPFANGGGDGGVKSIVNKQYNTPVGIYSDESIAETLSAQAEVLAGGVLGVNFKKNEKEYQGDRSEVLKFLREEETGQSTPEPHSPANFYWTQSHAIGGNERRTPLPHNQFQSPTQLQTGGQDERIGINLQQNTLAPAATHRPSLPVAKQQTQQQQSQQQQQQQQPAQADPRNIVMPICPALQGPNYKADMDAATVALSNDAGGVRPLSASGHPTCQLCGVGIVGVFVRIKDKNLHVECFKCATCGTSLKNQGYYNFNNKLYCDIHAKQAAQQHPPAGTEGYVPVPIQPNTKLSASTISSALSSHGYSTNGYNGNSAPAPATTATTATAADNSAPNQTQSEIMSANVADEQSSSAIYGQINTSNYNTNNIYTNNNNSDAAASTVPLMQTSSAPGSDQPPFEYVTLTGNVIRSVQPSGKGAGANYRVNQGYARPYGASQPPAAAPKSPVSVSYPPQQQQQQQQSPRPAGNPYATLPRTNVGQQAPSSSSAPTLAKPNNMHANQNATMPRPQKATDNTPNQNLDTDTDADATAMLADSIGKINMGEQTNAFMQEAAKIISNMLEARLASNGNGSAPLSHAGSTLSLRSNSNSNLSKSPMIVRKRLDLDDFKNIDPTQPVALHSVVAVPPTQQKQPIQELGNQKAEPQVARVELTLPAQHPMGKILDMCDNGKTPTTTTTVAQQAPEPVAFRNNLRRTGATHAADRRSYIEPKQNSPSNNNNNNENNINNSNSNSNNSQPNAPSFSVCVRALGDAQGPMSEENEKAVSQLLKDGKRPVCCQCNKEITSGPFITALGRIWCPDHFICVNGNCRRPLQDIGFVEEKGDLYCEYCFEKYLAPTCSKCAGKIKGDCLNAIGKHFHPECFTCGQCGKIFGNTPFFLEDGNAYCEADWNELFTTKCFACGFPVEAGDRWVEALNHNYHSQCFNCTFCKQNLEGQSFYNKGGRPFCKNHAR